MRDSGTVPVRLPVPSDPVCSLDHAAYDSTRTNVDGVLVQVSMRQGTTSWKQWVSNNVLDDTTGAQIVEFAVTLPLLVAIFVGIYDFTNAFNLKQKLTVAIREGARFSSNQSTSDLTNSTLGSAPNSINVTRDVIDNY